MNHMEPSKASVTDDGWNDHFDHLIIFFIDAIYLSDLQEPVVAVDCQLPMSW